MIIRGRLPADNYTITSNAAIEDTSISLKARMILVYLLSRPPGWVTSAERLAKTISEKDGLSAIKSGLRELEQAGYLTRTRTRDEHGHWRWDHEITDRPSVENRPVVDASPQVRAPKASRKPKESTVTAPSENQRSSIGGFSTGGSSVDGQPSGIKKTEVTKTHPQPPPSLTSDLGFSEFWAKYPPCEWKSKTNKTNLRGFWFSLSDEQRAQTIVALDAYKASALWAEKGDDLPGPKMFLENEPWLEAQFGNLPRPVPPPIKYLTAADVRLTDEDD